MHRLKRLAAAAVGTLTTAAALLTAGGAGLPFAAFAPSTAQAQVNPFTVRPPAASGLEKDDIDRLGRAAERLYAGNAIGTVERWRSPDTGNSGSVKLLRVFTAKDGMPCRTLRYRIRLHGRPDHAPDQYVVDWCRTASGEWKTREATP